MVFRMTRETQEYIRSVAESTGLLTQTAVMEYALMHSKSRFEEMRNEMPEFEAALSQESCAVCSRSFYQHPLDEGYRSWHGHPFLRKLCDGRLVKLV